MHESVCPNFWQVVYCRDELREKKNNCALFVTCIIQSDFMMKYFFQFQFSGCLCRFSICHCSKDLPQAVSSETKELSTNFPPETVDLDQLLPTCQQEKVKSILKLLSDNIGRWSRSDVVQWAAVESRCRCCSHVCAETPAGPWRTTHRPSCQSPNDSSWIPLAEWRPRARLRQWLHRGQQQICLSQSRRLSREPSWRSLRSLAAERERRWTKR